MLARSTEAAQSLLGEKFSGILNSDRYNAYNWQGDRTQFLTMDES